MRLPFYALACPIVHFNAIDAFRKRTFALIAKAYTSIQLQRAQVYLGLTAEQVVNGMFACFRRALCMTDPVASVAVPSGWEFHETSYILTPPKLSKSAHSRVAFPGEYLLVDEILQRAQQSDSAHHPCGIESRC